MRVLVIYAHPVETSYNAALHDTILRVLGAGGHSVRDIDLYAEDFDPRLSRWERLHYHDPSADRPAVARYAEAFAWAEAVVFCYPVWNYGLPAILKGFFDRVLLPGVAFEITGDGKVRTLFGHIRKLAAVTSYGQSRWLVRLGIGDLPRAYIMRYFRRLCATNVAALYLAHYGMNTSTSDSRAAFLHRVERRLARF